MLGGTSRRVRILVPAAIFKQVEDVFNTPRKFDRPQVVAVNIAQGVVLNQRAVAVHP